KVNERPLGNEYIKEVNRWRAHFFSLLCFGFYNRFNTLPMSGKSTFLFSKNSLMTCSLYLTASSYVICLGSGARSSMQTSITVGLLEAKACSIVLYNSSCFSTRNPSPPQAL